MDFFITFRYICQFLIIIVFIDTWVINRVLCLVIIIKSSKILYSDGT